MSVEKLKSEQYAHIAREGGYLNLREADNDNNYYNRAIIRAFKEENKTAYLGKINYYGDERIRITGQNPTDVLIEYIGQMVYNFGADYIVPVKDEQLESLVRTWNINGGNKEGLRALNRIEKRIEELGGIQFIWS